MHNSKIIQNKNIDIVIEAGFKKNKFDCRVCKLSLSGLQDVESIEAYGMCVDCQELFYWPNIEKCKNGWMPKKEEVHNKLNNYYIVKEK